MRNLAPTESSLFQGGQGTIINTPPWMQYFQQVYDYYRFVLKWIDPGAVGFGQNEPSPKFIGLMAYADGVNWNPDGSGAAGYYEWNGAIWVILAGTSGTVTFSHIYNDIAGSGRRFYIQGISIVNGTDENENPKEYFSPVIKEL